MMIAEPVPCSTRYHTDDAERFGILRSQLKQEGNIIGPYDMLIAAQAISKNLILVTN